MHYGHGCTLGSPSRPQHGLHTVCPCQVAQYNCIWVPDGHVGWDVWCQKTWVEQYQMSFSNGLGELGLGEMGLGELGLGEMGGHRILSPIIHVHP